jgi:N-acetylmuramoyl-L-alanine amidase
MSRAIRKIILHASGHAGDTVAKLDAKHRARGLRGIGFHFVIRESGQLERGRPLDEPGAHCLGHNGDSIGICLSGEGYPTQMQIKKTRAVVRRLQKRFPCVAIFRVGDLDHWTNDPLQINLAELKGGDHV